MANAFGSLDRKNTEDVIQPRLREIDRLFFITRERRLFTEVVAPDGIASGFAQVGLFMSDKNAPDEFCAVFQGAIVTWQASVRGHQHVCPLNCHPQLNFEVEKGFHVNSSWTIRFFLLSELWNQKCFWCAFA